MAENILTQRELNRATLARQFLLERAKITPLDAIAHLVGMQAQNHNAPYIGLWTRLHTFQRDELTHLLEDRQVVKASLMRSTLHLMTADDYISFRLVLQPALSRALQPFFAAQTNGIDSDAFAALLQEYIQEQPRTGAELRAKFADFFPDLNPGLMSDSMRAQLPLVQIFPSGTWGFTGRPAHAEASSWLGRSLAKSETALHSFLRRYLAAFGPASVKDIQTWSRLTRLQGPIDELRSELLTFHDEQGHELFDLPNAPRPAADSPAPVRFLPEFDNLLLSYADRQRILKEEDKPAVFTSNGLIRASVLIDGFVSGIWKVKRTPTGATLQIELFTSLTDQTRQDLQAEGERLMRWFLDGEESFEIQFSARQG